MMTVAELRTRLIGLPDYMPVIIYDNELLEQDADEAEVKQLYKTDNFLFPYTRRLSAGEGFLALVIS
jgi:hypothetical protein